MIVFVRSEMNENLYETIYYHNHLVKVQQYWIEKH